MTKRIYRKVKRTNLSLLFIKVSKELLGRNVTCFVFGIILLENGDSGYFHLLPIYVAIILLVLYTYCCPNN